jgi:hypothetical protein
MALVRPHWPRTSQCGVCVGASFGLRHHPLIGALTGDEDGADNTHGGGLQQGLGRGGGAAYASRVVRPCACARRPSRRHLSRLPQRWRRELVFAGYLVITIEAAFLLDQARDVWLMGVVGGGLFGLLLGAEFRGALPLVTIPFVAPLIHLARQSRPTVAGDAPQLAETAPSALVFACGVG